MSVQKRPVTDETVGDAIFQFWRNGQNATVESVMKALGSTHRQKVNDLMAIGRGRAGEMIQTREAESQLDSDFPVEAFGAIRDWAKKVAEVRLQDWEAELKDREAALIDQKQTIEAQLQTAQQQLTGMEIQNSTLQQQLAEARTQAEKAQAALQAKCDGLEQALTDARERAGQAEARLEVTTQTLKSTQADVSEQKVQIQQLTLQRNEREQDNKELSTQLTQISQQLDSHREQAAERDRNYQAREAAWLTERDERIRSEAEKQQQQQQQKTQLVSLQEEYSTLVQRQKATEQDKDILKAELLKMEQTCAAVQLQFEAQRSDQADKGRRLIELERQNAALLAELAHINLGAK